MYSKFLIAFLLLTSTLYSQEFNKLDEKGLKQGVWKGYYEESKRPRYTGTFEHGQEVGLFQFFDDTKAGTVIATREFNSQDHSCYTIFYNQKKNKVSEGKVVNKQFEGEWKYYHEDSNVVMTLENYESGKLTGVRKVFYESGKLAEETTYKLGVKEGPYKSYAENGVVMEESFYKGGEYDGKAVFKNAGDQVVGEGVYKNGKKVGIWKVLEKDKLKEVNMNKKGKKFVRPVRTATNE
jgi:antitoxin component YwqK of YwqJK toxin-antitoxin module